LGATLAEYVDPSANLMTDGYNAYKHLGTMFASHASVDHSKGEYARGDAHSNTVESAFSLLKRGMYGTFHSVSKHHLHRYLAEFEFKWNTRAHDDGARTALAMRASVGRRLVYRIPGAA
jgi:hypothetical protein